MKLIKEILHYIIAGVIAALSSWFLTPMAWTNMNDASTSFMANLFGIGLFLSTIPLMYFAFLLICLYESFYKLGKTYDPHKRKWVKK